MLNATDSAILHHLRLLDDQLMRLNHEACLAIEALTVERNRNLAIGTILPMQERLRLASQLVEVILAVHRLAPEDAQDGGAS
ncbi:MAG: hypothetical protein KJ587_11885 [Alphaproteobacteria bacterium]|nr:hypothetical protein [Alphaproteobacteria bacterium]